MKTIYIIILSLVSNFLTANPILIGVNISEIYFDETGNWTLEIDQKMGDNVEYIDSIKIESNSGIAKVMNFDTTNFILISNNNLNHPITINKDNDCIKLYSYMGEILIDSIAIGEYPGSYLHNIINNQSIARSDEFCPFYKDNSPTIGTENDLDGSRAKFYGYIYDIDNKVVKNKYFSMSSDGCGKLTQIDENGWYCSETVSRSYSISELRIYDTLLNYELMHFQKVNFELDEHDSINVDFIRIITSVNEVKQDKVLLTNYPNPANEFTYFIFEVKEKDISSFCISIYDLSGRLIDTFIPQSGENKYNCSNLKQGTYMYTLSLSNHIIGANKLQIIH